MPQPFQITSILVFLPIFCCIQLFLVFRCIGISSHRKKVFWLVLIYTIIFRATESWLAMMPAFDTSISVQLTHSLVHAFNTFILLTIIAVYGNGYFPRNFVAVSFYYDILTSLPCTPAAILTEVLGARFLPPDPGEYTDYPAGCIIMLAVWLSALLTIMAVYYLFRKKLNWLFSKIPDGICLAYFLLSFLAYVLRQTFLLTRSEYVTIHGTTGSYINTYLLDFSYGLLIIILLLILLLARTAFYRRQLQRIQHLESGMLLDYYRNVSTLHGSIRSLRHDLSNHLSIPEEGYRKSLQGICDHIDLQIRQQLSWQSIQAEQLSAREKYEIHQYLQRILRRHRLPPEALCITSAENGLAITIDTSGCRPLHPLLLRCSSFYRMLQIILKQHNGSVTWKKGDHSCTLQLHF